MWGAVAQLIERVVRNDEVVGLIPICSTILRLAPRDRNRGFDRRRAGSVRMAAGVRPGTIFAWQTSFPARFNTSAILAPNLLLRSTGGGRNRTPNPFNLN
jgi:hypothetical protein